MNTNKTLVLLAVSALFLSGCARTVLMSEKTKSNSNSQAQASGEAHINAIGALSRKLQSEKLCIDGLKEKNDDPDVNVAMAIGDDTGNVTWSFNSNTSRDTKCSYN
jgi:hypothetical protein